MFNKKAQKRQIIWGLFVLTIILIIGASKIFPAIISGTNELVSIGEELCQCGKVDEINYEIEHEGVSYCIISRNPCTETQETGIYQTIHYSRLQNIEPTQLCVYLPSDCNNKK